MYRLTAAGKHEKSSSVNRLPSSAVQFSLAIAVMSFPNCFLTGEYGIPNHIMTAQTTASNTHITIISIFLPFIG